MENASLDLDGYDLRILLALQEDGRKTNVELAEVINLSASQCSRRLQRLEKSGIISGYRVRLNRELLGFGVMALVSINLERHGESPANRFHETIRRCPEVLDCWAVSGDADYVLRVSARTLKHFSRFLMNDLMGIKGVSNLRSSIVLENIKTDAPLPLQVKG